MSGSKGNSNKNNSSKKSRQNIKPLRIKTSAKPSSALQQSASRTQRVCNALAKSQTIHASFTKSALNTDKETNRHLIKSDALNEISMNAVSSLKITTDYSAVLQATRPTMERVIKTAKAVANAIDMSPIINAFNPIAVKLNRLNVLTKAEWPLYLIENQKACERIDSLPEDITDDELKSRVSEIAYECLNEEWLNETKAIWESHKELSDGEKKLLVSALERHRINDFEGCVSLLMNIFEGLIEKYAPQIKALNGEQAELFDMYAGQLGLKGTVSDGKPRNLRNIKDKVLMILITSESGWMVFDKAIEYLVKITLTNGMNADIAAHNPLRNKICHGEQTEFGTLEHSLKPILVTDLIIRYGGALLEGQSLESASIEP